MASSAGPNNFARITERNITALLKRRRDEAKRESWQVKLADSITKFTGSMTFVYLHLVMFGTWIIINLPWIPGPKFDPSYVILAMFASVEAIFLSTFILITQNRQAQMADQRADLDLQVSLLAEHEITRILEITAAMARKMGVEEAKNPELAELERDVAPEQVLDKIEQTKEGLAERDRAQV